MSDSCSCRNVKKTGNRIESCLFHEYLAGRENDLVLFCYCRFHYSHYFSLFLVWSTTSQKRNTVYMCPNITNTIIIVTSSFFQIRRINWSDSSRSIFCIQFRRCSVWHRGRSSIENPTNICSKHIQVSFERNPRNNCERIHRLGTPNTASHQYSVSSLTTTPAAVQCLRLHCSILFFFIFFAISVLRHRQRRNIGSVERCTSGCASCQNGRFAFSQPSEVVSLCIRLSNEIR